MNLHASAERWRERKGRVRIHQSTPEDESMIEKRDKRDTLDQEKELETGSALGCGGGIAFYTGNSKIIHSCMSGETIGREGERSKWHYRTSDSSETIASTREYSLMVLLISKALSHESHWETMASTGECD
ncbi:hypothetical protein SELMODRAFT_417555 [Selaginella moellendorffii]|uniref:Uncharacterized protein n=1 Tax=Selaginella moellendorffii TaxID=88036 RepID=D8S2U7_SELML|nr:hypothetical protein SELMODRAFT_417555 [Selaginella moellendorffii]